MVTSRYFVVAVLVTIVGLMLGGWVGYIYGGSLEAAVSAFSICLFLSILEVSLSFDNAVVNARVLETMKPRWQKRFLTWGILIAVFGMRIVFPLAVVAVAAEVNPFEALRMAIDRPADYSHVMQEAHLGISAFGGTFLMMVALKFFFDRDKDVHWFSAVERQLARFAQLQSIEIAVVLVLLLGFAAALPADVWSEFVSAGIWGLLTFLATEALSCIVDSKQECIGAMQKAGFGAFLYLEMLDASFSFDGVVGAFAVSSNLFIIAIGLGIGAFYIRSMTIMLVEKQALTEYRYLEHGAFYAVLALAIIMYAQSLVHVPEMLTGLIGAVLILLSIYSSVSFNRRNRNRTESATSAFPRTR